MICRNSPRTVSSYPSRSTLDRLARKHGCAVGISQRSSSIPHTLSISFVRSYLWCRVFFVHSFLFFLLTPLDVSEKAMEATRLLCAARRACGRKNGEEDFIVTLIVHPFTTFTLSERISEIGKHTEKCKLSPVIHTLGRGIYAPKEVSSRCWCTRIRSERRRKNEVCKWY